MMYMFVYYSINVMTKTYFSDETYKLPNFNNHKLLALDRSIAGHDVSLLFSFRYQIQNDVKFSMGNGLKMNCKWPLRRTEMGTVV
jgi:hypothetical protein